MVTNNRTLPVVIGPPQDHLMTQANLSQYFYESLLDRVKTSTALLFCGIFLALVGVTFTAMGWQHYRLRPTLEWPQMLGPVLISLGGTFVLTSVFRFGMVSCWSCRQWDRDALEGPGMEEEASGGPAVTMSRPIMAHSGPVVCFPPPYSFIVQQDGQTSELQSRGLTHLLPPAFYRTEKTEERRPPAYQDIYPTSEEHRHTLGGRVSEETRSPPALHQVLVPGHRQQNLHTPEATNQTRSNTNNNSFHVAMEVRPDEHAIIRSSRPGSAGLGVRPRSRDSLGFHLNVSQELIQTVLMTENTAPTLPSFFSQILEVLRKDLFSCLERTVHPLREPQISHSEEPDGADSTLSSAN
ncbi:uncharacterized protein tmem174 [Synchiropus splendidus]|uniref:uncharacterized protein tmem174 n=1 Tax=Synchiropus splendidus TaxID=270530 RepID=UPI00237E06B7|nr:uncharacterized protein tmem174 [Synchiropus splendidus]